MFPVVESHGCAHCFPLTKRTPCGGQGAMLIDTALPLCQHESAPGGRERQTGSRWTSPLLLRAPLAIQLGAGNLVQKGT